MAFQIHILGYNSALPTVNSHPTAQLINVNERLILIDCGEGTQVQLRKIKAKFSKINHVFISHLHGDHIFGLIGFISSLMLLGKTTPMHIFGPLGIKDFIENQLKHTQSHCNFDLIFYEMDFFDSRLIFEDKKVEVYNLPLDHRIYCNGFLIKEKPKLKNLKIQEVLKFPEIETCDYLNLKLGKDFKLSSGQIIPNELLTYPQEKPLSYAFCSDTRYRRELVDLIQNVDLMYHEATFGSELEEMAKKTGHSTARQAALIAREANAGQLILGHFSNRYREFNQLLNEAKEVFPNSILPKTLQEFTLERV
ncbi:MAG: ribonuclease Z [Flavobacteriaceae bacterium]|nr:ribonuclease Z [Flavobacteriaceae bacterium]